MTSLHEPEPAKTEPGLLKREIHLNIPVQDWWLWVPIALTALSSAWSLLLYIIGCANSRFLCDDYNFMNDARERGILAGTSHFYQIWGGRYASNLLLYTITYLGPRWAPPASLFLLASFMLALAWCLRELCSACGIDTPRGVQTGLVLLLSGGVFYASPTWGQNFYWMSGAWTYTFPVILFLVALAYMARLMRPGTEPSAGGLVVANISLLLLAFVATGCSEIFGMMQCGFYGLALFPAVLIWRRSGRGVLAGNCLASLLGSSIGMVLFGLAPGNTVRQSAFGHHRTLASSWNRSMASIERYDQSWMLHHWIVLAFLCFLIGLHCKQANIKLVPTLIWAVLVGLGVRLLLALGTFPTAYARGFGAPYRAMFILLFFLLAWSGGSGLALGMAWHSWFERVNAAQKKWLVGALTLWGIWWTVPLAQSYVATAQDILLQSRDFRESWEAREAAPQGTPAHYAALSAWSVSDLGAALNHRDEPFGSPPVR